jgi:hypothetical protein
MVVIGSPASAQRKATKTESRTMWRALDATTKDSLSDCVQHRGRISTVKSSRYRYGKITIADATCGNGETILRRSKRRGGKWRVRGGGSDWGNPTRCAHDVMRIPIKVLRDFFPRICPGF